MFTPQAITDATPFAIAVAAGLMLALESRSPLVPLLSGRRRALHAWRNASIALVTGVFAVGGSLLLVAAAAWTTANEWGLLNWIGAPALVRFVVALVGLDFVEYFRHRLHHRVPLLWRLHRVHHSDPHVDATTAVRGHPVESLIAYSLFSGLVVLLGIDPLSLAIRSLIAAVALAWHHASFKLPERLDFALSLVTPTPRTHRLHHSREVRFTDSNYGTLFTWWDRVFGTFSPGALGPPEQTGLQGFDSEQDQSLWGVMLSPLKTVQHDPLPAEEAGRGQRARRAG